MGNGCESRLGAGLVAAVMLAWAPAATAADAGDLQAEIGQLRRQMEESQAAYQRRIEALEARIGELEDKSGEAAPAPAVAAPSAMMSGTGFQIGFSGEAIAGGSSVGDDSLSGLQAGGHDPVRNGFNVPNTELFVGGAVDPYFDAQANVVFLIDAEGETVVELEEAFATTRSLPFGLQVKAGQYFTEFGRQNPMHPHQWAFVDQPVILSRLFGGDGLRSQGARVAWLTPLPWYSELYFGAQNARGETVTSFLGEEGEEVGGFALLERQSRNFSDLLYSTRWLNGFEITDSVSANVGVSALYGPNATGHTTDTSIYGADVYAKWQPAYTERGFPFVSLQAEALRRLYDVGDPGTEDARDLRDWGFYAQGLYGFAPGWVAGLRVEHAVGDGDSNADPLRDHRWRLSPNLTWYPTEFSKLRLQYNRDWAEHLPDENTADTVWLQFEYSLGSHFAHTF